MIGVLLINLGTPNAPTPTAVRRYLKQLLWDPRVVEIPRPLWWLILHFFILPFRPKQVAPLYQKIWTKQGSPLLQILQQQAQALAAVLAKEKNEQELIVKFAVRHGSPSIEQCLTEFKKLKVEKLIILPLFPQYSAATTGSVFDEVSRVLKSWRAIPTLQFVNQYATEPSYIEALANSIEKHWQTNAKAELLLFSFHGLPQRCVDLGDPYYDQCLQTVKLVTERLKLSSDQYRIAFQSRLGRATWLKPYTEEMLMTLPKEGIRSLDIICPGFSADCLETLEEIAIRDRELFLEAGGKKYDYIPALNVDELHILTLKAIITSQL